MRGIRRALPITLTVLIAALLAAGPVQAEVGVVHTQNGAFAVILYHIRVIDDPDPIAGIRDRLSPPDSNRAVLNPESDRLLVTWAWSPAGDSDVVVSRFENGVWTAPDVLVGAARPYRMSIIEDPEPIGTVWGRVSSPSSNRAVLNADGDANGDGPPSLLYDPVSNLPVVAWSRSSPGGYDVVVSRFENGTWTAPEVLAGSAADELDPSLVLASDGSVYALYWIMETMPSVWYRKGTADLSSWSAPVRVSQVGLAACRPSGAFHEGALRVAYEVHDYGYGETPRQVVLAREEQPGTFVREVVAITQNADPEWPQTHSHNGRLWLDWVDAPGEIAWTRTDATGSWEPIQLEPFATEGELELFVRGALRYLAIQP